MEDIAFLFRGWEPVARVVFITAVGYAALLVVLRVSGQRTLAQMTSFDFVIAVTIGSAFGRVLTAENVGLVEVVTTFVMLAVMQWVAAWLRDRVPRFARVVSPDPSLLYLDGQFVHAAMRRHRITEGDLMTAAREKGLGSLAEAKAIILEPNGKFAVLSPSQLGDASALRAVPSS